MFSVNSISRQSSGFLTISIILFIIYLLISTNSSGVNNFSNFVKLMTTSNWSNLPAVNTSAIVNTAANSNTNQYLNTNAGGTTSQNVSQAVNNFSNGNIGSGIVSTVGAIGSAGNSVMSGLGSLFNF